MRQHPMPSALCCCTWTPVCG